MVFRTRQKQGRGQGQAIQEHRQIPKNKPHGCGRTVADTHRFLTQITNGRTTMKNIVASSSLPVDVLLWELWPGGQRKDGTQSFTDIGKILPHVACEFPLDVLSAKRLLGSGVYMEITPCLRWSSSCEPAMKNPRCWALVAPRKRVGRQRVRAPMASGRTQLARRQVVKYARHNRAYRALTNSFKF